MTIPDVDPKKVTILHLGAGYCSELPEYLAIPNAEIYLIESESEIIEYHQEQHSELTNLHLIQSIVGTEAGEKPFYRFSFSDLNSLSPAKNLHSCFPSVKLTNQSNVLVRDIIDVIEQCALDGQDNVLVIDLPGIAFNVFFYLELKGCLNNFSNVNVYIGHHDLYEHDTSADEVLVWAKDQGFELKTINSDHDVERPRYEFMRHPLYIQLKSLELENSQLSQDKQSLTNSIAELNKKLDLLQQADREKTEKLDTVNQVSKIQAEKLQQLEKQLAESQHLANARHEKITALDAQLTESQKTLTTTHDTIHKLKADLDAQTKDKQSINEKAKSLEVQLIEVQKTAAANVEALNKLKGDLEAKVKENQAISEKAELLEKALSEKQVSFSAEQEKLNTQLQAAKKQLEDAQEKTQRLETQLNAGKEMQHGLSELQKQMEYLFDQNRLQLEQATNALGQHITHTGKLTSHELQTFVQCQQTLGQNTDALHYQDQSLSPEFALYLSQKLSKGNFDVILVFGSAVITHFIATQLQQGTQKQTRLTHQDPSIDDDYVLPDQGDLPKRILAFQHIKSDCNDLAIHLKQSGLQNCVNLTHAPLIECRFSGKDYLYYDLRKPLARLADVFEERHAKIMVLVSPDQASETLAFEACLPALLQELSTHQLELVLHPISTQIESLKTAWQALLDGRDLEYTWVEDTSINVTQLTINP